MAQEKLEGMPRARDPESERALLSREIAGRLEHASERDSAAFNRQASEVLAAYERTPKEDVLESKYALSESDAEAITLNLSPEAHDDKMNELLGVLEEKGIRNTLHVVEKLDDAHIRDDFHRFLVQYVKSGYPVRGLAKKGKLRRTLALTLFEITLPEHASEEARSRELKDVVAAMEQFYAGMRSLGADGPRRFAFEMAVPVSGSALSIYAAVPERARAQFEKHLFAAFPSASITEVPDDYNVFMTGGAASGSYAAFGERGIFPLTMYESFSEDPLNVLLNSFAKIGEGEGAAIQFVCSPDAGALLGKYKRALEKVRRGTPVKEATDIPETFGAQALKLAGDFVHTHSSRTEEGDSGETHVDETAVQAIERKIQTPLMPANIRILTSAADAARAEGLCEELESAFNQFEDANGNRLVFKRQKRRALSRLSHDFTYRIFSRSRALPLSIRELATLAHLPVRGTAQTPHVRHTDATTAPAPLEAPDSGLLIGINRHRGDERNVYLAPEDRLRHFYVIGQTGTGKTTLLKNMLLQDIENGEGACMIDPHGPDVEAVLGAIPARRAEDVIYFAPASGESVMGLNMLEYDTAQPEQKTFVVNELFSIFQKLYADVPESMGPMFEQYFRNAAMLVLEDPESGSTLLDISRVLSDARFRERKLARAKNPVVVEFWRNIAAKAGGESELRNIVPYITSKFDVFTANDIIRPIIAQQHSSFNLRTVMDERKILLVNLSKGQLGDINAHLLGMILVGKILMAALSRADQSATEAPPFYLYIDEFQNTTTDSITTILSEARKYRLALTVAHQYIGQLDESIQNAVFGNIGSLAAFRVGADDAEFLEQHFSPPFSAHDLTVVENRNAYVRLLANGRPATPFSIETLPPNEIDPARAEAIKDASRTRYGRPRERVEEEIRERYRM